MLKNKKKEKVKNKKKKRKVKKKITEINNNPLKFFLVCICVILSKPLLFT